MKTRSDLNFPYQNSGKISSLNLPELHRLISEKFLTNNTKKIQKSILDESKENITSDIQKIPQPIEKKRFKPKRTLREIEEVFDNHYQLNSIIRLDMKNMNEVNFPILRQIQIKQKLSVKNELEKNILPPISNTRKSIRNQPLFEKKKSSMPVLNAQVFKRDIQHVLPIANRGINKFSNNKNLVCQIYQKNLQIESIPIICSRKCCSFFIENNIGVIIGGIGRKTFEDAITFNFETQTVKKQKNILFQRTNHVTVKCGNFVFIHGGQVYLNFMTKKVLSDMFMFIWS